MMKKFFFSSPLTAAILTALTFAACSQSDTIADGNNVNTANNAPQAVEFGTYMGAQGTRAGATGDINTTKLQESGYGFGVFAYHTGTTDFASWTRVAPNFMYNQSVQWSTNKWDYQPVKYWPNGTDAANETNAPSNSATEANAQKLSFFAYAPYVQAYQDVPYESSNEYIGIASGATEDEEGEAVLTTSPAPTSAQNGIVAMSKNTETGDMYVKYILNPAADANRKFVDLLWGLRGQVTYDETDNSDNTESTLGAVYNVNLTKQNVDEKVKFLFKHALARVGGNTSKASSSTTNKQISGLKVVVDVDANSTTSGAGTSSQTTYFSTDFSNTKTLVTIEEVSIRDKYTYDQEQTVKQNWTSDFLTDGWFDIMTGTWSNTNTVLKHTTGEHGVTYSVKADKNGTDYALNPDIMEGTVKNSTGADWQASDNSAAGYTGGATGVTTTAKDVYSEDADVPGLLLIPGNNDNTLYVTVKYIVRTADANLSTGYTEVAQTITNKVQLNGSVLKPNTYYTLVMHLGLTSVKFEAVVADWSTADDSTFDENGTEQGSGTAATTSVWLPSNVVTATSTPNP